MAGHNKKKFPLFGLGYVLFLLLLILFWVFVLLYVQKCLLIYEAGQPEHVVEALVQDLADGNAEKYFSFPSASSRFEDPNLVKSHFLETLSSGELRFEKAPGSYDVQKPAYDLYAGTRKIATAKLREISSEPLMLILTAQEWELAYVEPVLETGERDLLIRVPNSCTVLVNGIPADERELTGNEWDIEEFEFAANYVSVPYLVEYQLSGLFDVPKIEIRNELGQEMGYTEKEGILQYATFPSSPMEEELSAYVLKNAKNYSDFFSGDLAGGRSSVQPLKYMFPEGSYFLELADNYRKFDLWMYSQHQTPTFANEKVTNYVRYSEDFFSCHVYFEKTMYLTKTGETRTVVTNDQYYYVKQNDKWVIADMRTVLGEERK